MTSLTIKNQFGSYTVEVPHEDLNVSETVEMLFRPVMLSVGYHEKSLKDVIREVDDDALIRYND